MKNFYISLLILVSSSLFSQAVADINKVIGIPDSLNKKEIRIYKNIFNSNGVDIFRLYEYEANKWKSEIYLYYMGVDQANVQEHFEKKTLISQKENHIAWAEIINTNIAHLPDMPAIQYKLRGKIEFTDANDIYGFRTISSVLDGINYEILINSEDGKNHVDYSNPESYLEEYPGVDELESVKSLLDILKENFNIWKR